MPQHSSFSGRVRRFFKRIARGVKKVFRPKAPAPTTHPPSPPLPAPTVDPPPQVVLSHELVPALPSQSASPPQSTPSPGQPVSTTLHSINDGSQPTSAEPRLAPAAIKAGADAWDGLRATLQVLERSLDVFPTLKSAVAEFLGVVGTFETAAQNRNDYAGLASNLQNVVRAFCELPGEHMASRLSEALKAMAGDLEKDMEHVQEQRLYSESRQHMGAGQDLADVRGCYSLVERLCHELESEALVDIWRRQEKQKAAARLKKLNAALNAMFDSSLTDVVGRRTCTPGTREAILADMRQWTNKLEGPKVYWMNGMAGTGKTTLAYSFCAEMQRARRLGASFFCSRADADSRDVSRIVPTIAHQLTRLSPAYREALIRQIGEDNDIGTWTTKTQFERLIRDPLREVETSVPAGIVVMIDALDECESHEGARDILSVLLANARDLPIKFFVTCRPEPGLFDTLQSEDERYRSVLHLHDVDTSFVQADIQRYLEAELAETSLAQDKLGMLAEQAGALFIYAATAVRYIYPRNRRVNVHQRLDDLLSIATKASTHKHKGIDELYAAVLAAPFAENEFSRQEQENIRLVLDTAICAREPMSVGTMAKLMGLDDEQEVAHALQHLRSVLNVSRGTNLISTLHASFADFMLDRDRSDDLWCDAVEHNGHLALRCFSAMKRLLRFNICELESSFVLDESIPDLTEKIDNAISPELFYASRYWGDHFRFAEAPKDDNSELEDFLSNRLLFWMEVLTLRNCINAGAQMLDQVHTWLRKLGGAKGKLELALDASRFVTAFSLSPASRSTPHIYVFALPFWPETRPVRQRYWNRTRRLIRLEGAGIEGRDMSCLATWNIGSMVSCVALSPDGTRIASGSFDKCIRVWDARSGLLLAGPFKGHTMSVQSVAFSPDGTRIVSGSHDSAVRVWDSHSGLQVAGPFEGHVKLIYSVTFSPDGSHIVSGSGDGAISVLDLNTGLQVARAFQGHTDSVSSIAFSPDGTRIASGSHDMTISVWGAQSRLLVAGPFEGHTDQVNSIAFSPNGTRIVSGSDDMTLRVWDARNGLLVAGPFEGHTKSVDSVAYSPDGARIVSGSDDLTIRVWDAHSGLLVAGPFEGHTTFISSVLFSPDGARIISGSYDMTIRVWDAHSGILIAGPSEGHTNSVNCVAFSPDDTRIVSGSDDSTIRVWDAYSGLLVAGPFEGHTSRVRSVAFSSDGTLIVSGSSDDTIRIWDTYSGLLVAGPFEGHTNSVRSVRFSPDDTCVVSGSDDNTIRVWDARSGLLVAGPFEGHAGWVNSVAFSSDGTRIVSGSNDKTFRVWEARTGLLVEGPFQGHVNIISSVAFSPDGARIVSGSHDMTVSVWDANDGRLVAGPCQGHTYWIFSVAFSPDGTCVISGAGDDTIRVWDACSGLLVAGPFKGHTNSIRSVAYSSDGTRIVSGSDDKTVCVWNARSGLLVAGPLEGHTNRVRSVAFSPDDTRIVSGSLDMTVRVWDVRSGLLVAGPFEGHTNWVNSVTFSPDGTHIVSGSDDNTIRVWDACTGLPVAEPFKGHTGSVYSVAYSHDGTRIVSGSEDTTIRVWDARSGLLVAEPFEGPTDRVNTVEFSPDDSRIVSGSDDFTIHVWDAHTGTLITGPSQGHSKSVGSVAFSPDDTRIVSGSEDNTIRVWDAHSKLLVAGPFEGHTESVESVAYSPDGARIVSGSNDLTVRVWDAHSGLLVAGPFVGHTNPVTSVAFSSDGTRVVSGSLDHAIRVWSTTPLHAHEPGHFKVWVMDKTGMITTQQGELLLCIPVDLWNGLVRPQNMICIYAKGVLRLDFDDVLLGKEWSKCYQLQ